jgi:hypothetical protein
VKHFSADEIIVDGMTINEHTTVSIVDEMTIDEMAVDEMPFR